ncbi:MAG: hypothetical protein MUE84_08675 [Hyphomonas sp.]|jgi:hypothetical protein|nr:hypothetical protein [Hyphomonas sp.]
MTVKLSSLKADLSRENDGDWIAANEIGEGVQFKVRGLSYEPYTQAQDRLRARFLRKYPDGDIPVAESEPAAGELLAKHILLDWKGFDVPYSEDTAMDALTDVSQRLLRNAVILCASRVMRANIEFVETEGKNSARPSGRGSTGGAKQQSSSAT